MKKHTKKTIFSLVVAFWVIFIAAFSVKGTPLGLVLISEPDGDPANTPAYSLTFPNGTVTGSGGALTVDPSMGASTEIEDDVYGAGWNADTTHGGSQNAIYDYLINFDADADGSFTDEGWFPASVPDITFDIGDDGGDDSTAVAEIATTGDTNAIFTEPSADKILIDLSNNWPTCDAAVEAQTGDSASSFFSAGTLEHERGCLEADVSAYSAILGITGGATTEVDTEALLYSFLSDVTQFYEPNDLLQTESGNSTPTLTADGEMAVDTDDERFYLRVNAANKIFDFSGDTNGYVLTSNGSGLFTLQAGGGGTSNILDLGDDDSNESTDLIEIATSGDTNSIFTEPTADKLLIDVSQNWPTADAATTATSATTATTATTANAGDSATAFFSAGTIEHERGGLEANVSAYDGLVSISGGTTSATTITAFGESLIDDADAATARATLAAEADLSNEAGLYSALSDVSQFYEPGDLLRTEASNTPTTPSNDGEMVVDSDDDQFIFRVGAANKTFDFSGDSSGYVLKSNGSGTFTLAADASGGGGTPNILDLGDDASNESTDLIEIATSGDTNSIFTEPSADKLLIDVSNNWPTADTASTANAGDSATAFFSSGTIEHERGGLEGDVSAYSGLVKIDSGATSAVTTTAFAETILDDADAATARATLGAEVDLSNEVGLYGVLSDVSIFYEPGDTLQTNSGTSLPGTCTVGELSLDTDADTDGSLYACVATDTWKEIDDDGAGGTVDTTGTVNADEIAVFNDSDTLKALTEAEFKTAYNMEAGTDYQTQDSELSALAGTTSAADALPYFTGSGTASTTTLTSYGRSIIDDANEAAFKATTNLEIGTDVQAYDSELAALAGTTSAADALPYFTGSGTATTTTLTTFGRSIIDDASEAAFKATTNLEIGTDVQAYDSELAALAGTTSAADALPYFTGSGTASTTTLTTYGRSILDDANEATFKATVNLEIGTDVQAYNADLTEFFEDRTITDPVAADDYYWFKAPHDLTLSNFDCIVQGSSTPSITVDLQECSSTGASCTTVLSSAVTCDGGNDAATISDSAIDSGDWLYVDIGTPSGTVDAISFTLQGTK